MIARSGMRRHNGRCTRANSLLPFFCTRRQMASITTTAAASVSNLIAWRCVVLMRTLEGPAGRRSDCEQDVVWLGAPLRAPMETLEPLSAACTSKFELCARCTDALRPRGKPSSAGAQKQERAAGTPSQPHPRCEATTEEMRNNCPIRTLPGAISAAFESWRTSDVSLPFSYATTCAGAAQVGPRQGQ